MIIVGNSSAASFVKVTIENAKLAEICSSHGSRMTVNGSTLSYETDLGGHWISEEPRGGDFIEWLLQFAGELRILDRAACDEIRDRKEEINEGHVSSEIIYEYYNPEDDTFSCHWEERRTKDEIEVKGFDAYSWEKVWSEQSHQEIAKLYNGSIDNIENLSPGEYPLWKLLAEGWDSHSSGPDFVRKMMDKYATFRVSKNAGYENPEYDFLKKKTIDPDTIDFSGKTIGMAPVAYLYPDDNENKYYGSLGTAFDIAKTIVEQNGGKVTKSVSGNTDYVVVSNRMRVRDNRDAIRLSEDYRMYCDGQKRDREKIQESDERRKKKNKPEIRVIFEDEFHAWLRNKFDLMKQESDVFKAYGTINLMVRPFEISPGAYTFKFKSDWFADIPEERMKEATENLETLSEFISNIESFTKEGVFAESGSTKKTYSQLMEINEKYKFSDYEEVYFIYESSGGVNYRIIKQTDPGFDIQHTTIDQLKEYPYIESGIRRKLMDGRKVKVRCRLSDETDNAEDGIKVLNDLAEKLSSAGHVEKGPERENNSLCILIAPGRETSGDDSPLVFKRAKTVKSVNKVPIDALRINDHYDVSFLKEHGEEIKRVVVPEYAYSNSILLSHCPNIEEFIVAKNSSFSFEDGVLYSASGNTRSIDYITKNVKELHIEKDITDISYWHGVNKLTIDKNNSKFVVKDNMLLSRRMNSLYFVCADAEEVVIPEGVAQIHSAAFEYCEKLRKIVFPASYEWRGWYAPPGGLILNTNEGMRGAEVILNGNNARYENEMVILNPDFHPDVKLYLGDTELCRIPDKLGSPYGLDEAFGKVKNFEIGEQNPAMASVDGVILDKGKTKLLYYPRERETFVIPDCVKSIGDMALSNCNRLKDVVIPDHVISIGNMAFANCASLTSVTVMNPAAVIAGNAFLGCNFDSDNNESEIIDEEELKRSIEEEIAKIEKATSKGKKDKKKKSQDGPKKQFKYTDYLTFNLPEDFAVSTSTTDEGTEMTQLQWGDYQDEDSGDTLYQFTATLAEIPVETESDGKELSPNEIIDAFINGSSGELTSRTYIAHGDIPYGFFSAEMPVEVPMGFFGNIVLKNYIVTLGVVADGKVIMAFSNGYQNPENDDDKEKEDLLYEKLVEIVKGISVNGVPIDCQDLDEEKLRDAIEPLFSDSESTFSLNFGTQEEQKPEVRFAEDDDRKVIVDDKWSFVLPEGLDLRFDSEHVDIMGNSTTSKYVVEGLQYNGRFFFDFELRERFDDGMSTDVDVIGCRFDNDVSSGNAQQRIISDGDDLFVDMVNKPIFFFNSMTSIRVRGEEIRSWDFTAGMSSTDQDMSARWDEVKKLMLELAESIQLIGGSKKTAKKKKTQKQSDPDFIITNGVLRKYVGKDTDIVIPNGIKEIADSTFSGFTKLRSVVVPEGVKRIGRRCFENCTSLERCDLPDSLEELGGYAFVDCHKLKEVYLGKKLKSLGDSTFSECFVLNDVVIPEKIKEIEAFAFKNCDAFKHIVIPEGVKSIGFSAFAGCDKLEYLFIPKSVTEFASNSFNPHPFDGSKKLTIYTPVGSAAQKFAEKKGIPYKNADKGTVTADNSIVKSKTSTSKPVAGAAGTRTASGFSRQAGFRGSSLWTFPTADTSKVKTKFLSNKKGYAAGFIPTDVILKDPSRDKANFIYILETEKHYDKFDKTVSLANRCCESVMTPEEADEIKRGLLRTTAPMHALRSLVWTAINMNGGRIEDFIASAPDEMWLDMAQFIYGKGYVNYRPIDARGMGYGYALVRGEEVRSLYTYSREIYNPAEYYNDYDLGRTMTNASHLIVFDMVDILVDFIPAIEALLNGYDDSDDPKMNAVKQILMGWSAYAYACRCTFNVIPGDRISNKIIDADRSSWVDGVEIRELENGRFRAIGTELFGINDRRGTLVIPEGITDFYQPYLRDKSIRDDVEHVKKIIYPTSFNGTVLVPKYASEIELRGDFDDLNFTFGGGYYYSPDSANYDLHSIILLGRIKTVYFYNINNCKNVRELVLPEGLEELKAGAIDFDQHVTVTLPESLKKVDESAFGWSYKKQKRKLIVYRTCPVLPEIRKIRDKNPNIELSVIDPPWPSISRTFVNRIKPLYRRGDVENLYASVDTIVKDAFSDKKILTNCRKAVANEAVKADLPGLRTIMLSDFGDDEFCEKVTALITEDIEKGIEEEKQKKYDEAVNLSSGDKLENLNKAESMFIDLGDFKDSKDLLKHVSASIDAKKSAQYDEAVSLYNKGSEDAVIRAIEKLDELGQYKDAQTLSKEYRAYLRKERDYKSALEGIEKNELTDLRVAKEKLEGIAGFKDSEEMLMSCSSKLEAIMSEMYDEALSLAEQQTEESLTDAKAIISRLKPYRDSEKKIEELDDLIAKEKTYKSALAQMSEGGLLHLRPAEDIFTSIEGYKDSKEKAAECEKEIETFCKYNYVKARKAEKVLSIASQREAISLYRELQDYEDARNRIGLCQNNSELIKEVLGFEKSLDEAKKTVAKKKGSERKVYEEFIKDTTRVLDEKKKQLAAAADAESDVVSNEGLEDYELKTVDESVEQRAKELNEKIANVKKKGKKRWIAFGIILAVIAILGAVVLPNLMKPDLLKHGDMVDAGIYGLDYQVPEDWQIKGTLHTTGTHQYYTLSKNNKKVAALEVQYRGDTDLAGDAGYNESTAEHQTYKQALTDIPNAEGYYEMIMAGESAFEVTLYFAKDTVTNPGEFLTSICNSFQTSKYLNPREVVKDEVSYTGDTKAGTVLDDNNKGISALRTYKTGLGYGTKETEWHVREAVTLKPGKTSTLKVLVGGGEHTIDVTCTTEPEKEESDEEDRENEASDGSAGRHAGGNSASGSNILEHLDL